MIHKDATTPASPWHKGEKTLQQRMGVAERMEVVGHKIIRDHMPEQHRDFYRQLPFVLIGSVGADGDPWASALEGPPGFVHSPDPRLLRLERPSPADDPAADILQEGAAVGLLGIELHTRRRNRMNGRIQRRDAGGFTVAVEQSFGNCPKYIQRRDFSFTRDPASPPSHAAERMDGLDEAARALIRGADTCFVASYVDPEGDAGRRGVDVSHRGGKTGFIRVEGDRLTIPDFAGNLHFNTLGNLFVNGRTGLLFIDFHTGDALQLCGRAEILFDGPEVSAFEGAERLWLVNVTRVVRRPGALALRWTFRDSSPNSLMTGSWDKVL